MPLQRKDIKSRIKKLQSQVDREPFYRRFYRRENLTDEQLAATKSEIARLGVQYDTIGAFSAMQARKTPAEREAEAAAFRGDVIRRRANQRLSDYQTGFSARFTGGPAQGGFSNSIEQGVNALING